MEMGGRPVPRPARWGEPDPKTIRGLLLALFFLVGAAAGHLCAGAWNEDARASLMAYLTDYCAVYDAGGQTASMAGCLLLYFGYTAALLLLGFSSVGAALIPVLSSAFGFFTMYAVSCFVCCYGRGGVLLAMGALAVRLVFTMPCFFSLAGEAWPLSIELFSLSFGRGKRSTPVLYGSRYFALLVLCLVILSVGVLCERLLTPFLFRLAMDKVLP